MVTRKINKKKIRVGYTDITVYLTKPNFKKDNLTDCYGQYLQRENKIEIQPDLNKIEEANTLLHEILHYYLFFLITTRPYSISSKTYLLSFWIV